MIIVNYVHIDYLKIHMVLKTNMPGKYRSSLANFRCGTAPIKVETGRYENLSSENRTCFNCNTCVEDEKHVILDCPLYADLRNVLFGHACNFNENFINFTDEEKFIFIFNDENMCYFTAKIWHDILFRRRCILYS